MKRKILTAVIPLLSLALAGCAKEGAAPESEIVVETDLPVIVSEDPDTAQDMAQDTAQDTVTEEPVSEEADESVHGEEAEDTAGTSQDTVVPDETQSFYAEEISDELFDRMKGKSFPDECTTPREDLRYLHLLYKDIDGNVHEGEMVCNVQISDKLIDIFRQLYENDYPIEKMRLIDEYDGDDDASMADNNTSCFNFRVVSGTTKISKHGYGMAVDLNPFYNPYIHTVNGLTVIEPEGSEPYADREADFDYRIDEDDLAYKLFTEAGFTWGGSWKSMKDYQHFQMD